MARRSKKARKGRKGSSSSSRRAPSRSSSRSSSHSSSHSSHHSAPPKQKRRRGRRSSSRGFSTVGMLVAIVAGAAGTIGGVMLRNHAPQFVQDHPIATGIGLAAIGGGSGAALAHYGHPIAGTAVAASVGGMGLTELVGAGLAALTKSSDDTTDDTTTTDTPAGFKYPQIPGDSSAIPALGQQAVNQGSAALGDAINTVLGWANGQSQPQAQPAPGAPAPAPGGFPQVSALPSGYQDPLGAAVGIIDTLGQHVVNPATGQPYFQAGTPDPAAALAYVLGQFGYNSSTVPVTTASDGSATLAQQLGAPGQVIPTPYGPLTLNSYGLPADLLPPANWPAAGLRRGCQRRYG